MELHLYTYSACLCWISTGRSWKDLSLQLKIFFLKAAPSISWWSRHVSRRMMYGLGGSVELGRGQRLLWCLSILGTGFVMRRSRITLCQGRWSPVGNSSRLFPRLCDSRYVTFDFQFFWFLMESSCVSCRSSNAPIHFHFLSAGYSVQHGMSVFFKIFMELFRSSIFSWNESFSFLKWDLFQNIMCSNWQNLRSHVLFGSGMLTLLGLPFT